MSDKPDDPPPRLTGSSKSYNLDGDTAEFDPGALQVHEFSPEMRQQISATKLPRFKPRTPRLEPVPAAKKRLSQRFLRVVGVTQTSPVEHQGPVEEHIVVPVDGDGDAARNAPTAPPTRVAARATTAKAGAARVRWQWGLFALCLTVGVLCFWLTRPPSVETTANTTTVVHAAKDDSTGSAVPNATPAAMHGDSELLPQPARVEESVHAGSVQPASAPPHNSSPGAREPKPRVTSRAPSASNRPASTAQQVPKTSQAAQSAQSTEPQSVFDTAIRPPASRTRRN